MQYTSEEEGNLLAILVKLFPQSSKATLRKMLTSGRVTVDGKVCYRAKHEIAIGDMVEILDKVKASEESPSPKDQYGGRKLDIIYEDDALLVVIKPEGMLSIATSKLENDTLHSRCVDYVQFGDERGWCHIVHRLDRDTSGVMVFAKNKQLLASGVGQTSRVDALKQAVEKAKNFNFDLVGSVMASDAFFPFPDCVELANKSGISSVIQPGGSIKDDLSIEFCNKKNMSMVMTGTRHFKH